MIWSRTLLLAVVSLATVELAAAQPNPTSPSVGQPQTTSDPRAGSNGASTLIAAQTALVRLADSVSHFPQSAEALGGVKLDVPWRSLTVYWKGAMADSVREQIAGLARDNNIILKVEGAKYSKSELHNIARSVARRRGDYPGLVYVGPRVDGNGIRVALTSLDNIASLRFPDDTQIIKSSEMFPTSRAADTPPWQAGAIVRGGAGLCSSGFAAHRGSTVGIVTASHCGPGQGVPFFTGAGLPIGSSEVHKNKSSIDLMDAVFIPAASGAAPIIYDGGVGAGEFQKTVVAVRDQNFGVFPGMLLCVSGAGTGANCGMKVDTIDNNFPTSEAVAIAFPDDPAQVSTGDGDSGGPVFTLDSTPDQVIAAGMMIGGLNQVTCTRAGTRCFNQVLFVDLPDLGIFLDVTILPH